MPLFLALTLTVLHKPQPYPLRQFFFLQRAENVRTPKPLLVAGIQVVAKAGGTAAIGCCTETTLTNADLMCCALILRTKRIGADHDDLSAKIHAVVYRMAIVFRKEPVVDTLYTRRVQGDSRPFCLLCQPLGKDAQDLRIAVADQCLLIPGKQFVLLTISGHKSLPLFGLRVIPDNQLFIPDLNCMKNGIAARLAWFFHCGLLSSIPMILSWYVKGTAVSAAPRFLLFALIAHIQESKSCQN